MNSKRVNWLYLIIVLLHIGLVAGLTFWVVYIGPVNLPIVPNLLLSQSIILIPALLFALCSKEKLGELLGFRKIKISSVLMIVLFTYLMMPITTVINAISMLFVDNTVMEMSGSVLGMPMPIMVLVMGVIGPVSEEIVCRGVVFSGYKKSGNVFCAILLSAVIFGFMHMNFNQAAYAIFLGIIMALLVEATGSIWGSIVCHMTVNIHNVMLMYLSDSLTSSAAMQEAAELANDKETLLVTIGIYSVVAVVTTAIGVCVLAWVAKNEKKDQHLKEIWRGRKENRGKMITVPFVLAMLLALAYMIFEIVVV